LAYTVTVQGVPNSVDYAEVAVLTNNYLSTYFDSLFSETIFTKLDMVFTIFVSGNFFFNRPIQIDYETIAYFDADQSLVVPTVSDLDTLLGLAFEGENLQTYISQLQQLDSAIFASTTLVQVTNSSSAPLTEDEIQAGRDALMGGRSSDNSLSDLLAIIMGSAAGLLALSGLLLWRRHRGRRRGQEKVLRDDVTDSNSSLGENSLDPMEANYRASKEYHRTTELETSPLFTSPPSIDDEDDEGDFQEVGL
jgi:hypothetical protein